MRNKIFAILYLNPETKQIEFRGNGSVVSEKGDFVTAGHVFGKIEREKEINDFRAVFIDNENEFNCISFSKIYFKFKNKNVQKPSLWEDIAYGKLEEGNYEYFEIEDKSPSINEEVNAPHYRDNGSKTKFGSSFSELENIPFLVFNSPKMNIVSTDFAEILSNKYTNCIELQQDLFIKPGASGCPIVNKNGKIVGVFLGAPENSRKRYAVNSATVLPLIS